MAIATKYSRLFLCTALLQGLVLWWLNYAKEGDFPADPIIRTGMFFFAIATPLVIYLTHQVNELPVRARQIAVVIYGIAFFCLGVYLDWSTNDNEGLHFSGCAASAILGFVSVNLLVGFNFKERRWKYSQLFQYTWRNATLLLAVFFVTLVFWVVLYAGAALMELTGVSWVKNLIGKAFFVYPVSCLVMSGAFAMGLNRASIADTSRRFAVAVSSWLLVLLLFFSLAWVIFIPFFGWESLHKARHISLILCWFILLAVALVSCIYQDGQAKSPPYSSKLGLLVQVAWLSVLPLTAILCWTLFLRVQQYGWTPSRIRGALIATLAIIYSVGYALSWFDRSRWMSAVGGTNLVAAIFLCAALIALQTPIADINRLAVASHMNRIAKHAGSVKPDLTFLQLRTGRFGQQALKNIAEGKDVPAGTGWAEEAKEILSQQSKPDLNLLTTKVSAARFHVYPKGQVLPDDFLTYLQSGNADVGLKLCADRETQCQLWLGNLKTSTESEGGGQNQIVLLKLNDPYSNKGLIYSKIDGNWRLTGFLSGEDNPNVTEEQLNQAEATLPEWKDLSIAGLHYRIRPNQP